MRVKCLAREHNTMTGPGLEPGPLDPESGALTTRRISHSKYGVSMLARNFFSHKCVERVCKLGFSPLSQCLVIPLASTSKLS